MSKNTKSETLGFQTEVKQLLHLMIHSLYSNPEIFLRELISNASDASDKLRFASLTNSDLLENDPDLNIHITPDKEQGILVIEDNGIGMNREDVISNLGTIAKSGTNEFLKKMTGDQKKDANLIGQFGVGFYSSFIVADKVVVETRKAGETQGVQWSSAGEGEFDIKSIDKASRGTKITLFLKSDQKMFSEDWKIRSIIRKYSDHISLPVKMMKAEEPVDPESKDAADQAEKKDHIIEWETVNVATALWTRPRKELTNKEYIEFYKHITHDFNEPLKWSHNRVEGKLDYTSLLYIPSKVSFDLYNRDTPRGLKLYVQRVYIMDNAEEFLPLYLRFVKGVLDSQTLPLNISRELLQKDSQIENIKASLTKRILNMLAKTSKNNPEKYQQFWDAFGEVLKEGPAEDYTNQEAISELLRFSSTQSQDSKQNISLEEYIGRMQPDQKTIYYLCANNYETAKSSPHLELFRKKNIEVLLLTNRIDEWLMTHLQQFKEKKFQDISRSKLDLDDASDASKKEEMESLSKEKEPFLKRIEAVLKDQVASVHITDRLVDFPVCLVADEHEVGEQMRNMMKAMGQEMPETKSIMEINSSHAIIKRLESTDNQSKFEMLALTLFEQAQLSSGKALSNPSDHVKRVNQLLVDLA